MEMYLDGVSTRKVTKVIEKLSGISFSKFTVSQLYIDLDAKIDIWNNRSISEAKYSFFIINDLILKVRKNLGIVPMSMFIAIGVYVEGNIKILGIYLDNSENNLLYNVINSTLTVTF